MEQPPKHLTPHLYSEKRQFLHEFELPSNLTETAPRSSNFQPNPTPVAAAAAPCKLSSAHVVPAHSAAEAAVTTHPTKHSQHPRPPKPQWLFILAVSPRELEAKIPTSRKTAKTPTIARHRIPNAHRIRTARPATRARGNRALTALPLADAAPPRACRSADPGADADAAIPSSDRPPHQPGTSAAAASRSYRSSSSSSCIGSARRRRRSDPAAGRVVGAGG